MKNLRQLHWVVLIRRRVTLSLGVILLMVSAALAQGGQETEVIEAAKEGDLSKLKAFVMANPDLVNARDSLKYTPLHMAATRGDIEVTSFLLANDAKINAVNAYGSTPLRLAKGLGHGRLATILVDHGAKLDPAPTRIKTTAKGKQRTSRTGGNSLYPAVRLRQMADVSSVRPAHGSLRSSSPAFIVQSPPDGGQNWYQDPFHGFFRVIPPEGFTKTKASDKPVTIPGPGPHAGEERSASRVKFARGDNVSIEVIVRETLFPKLEEAEIQQMTGQLEKKLGSEPAKLRRLTVDGAQAWEFVLTSRGLVLHGVKFKKDTRDHTLLFVARKSEYPQDKEVFEGLLSSYHSIPLSLGQH